MKKSITHNELFAPMKERVEREIRSTDEGIARLVYELYGLTEDEVRIVEGEVND